jgi:hypothetical protein
MSRSYTLTNSGYGAIPDSVILKKNASTSFFHPDDLDQYQRSVLTDLSPDTPWLESDQTRRSHGSSGGVGSVEKLALRYSGARSEETPWLPDGTFLDHEFAIRDTRNVTNLPDFGGNGRHQEEIRASYTKFTSDEDFSVPSEGVNPVEMSRNIRGTQQEIADRLQIFDESFDSVQLGGAVNKINHSRIQQQTRDGTIIDLTEADSIQRKDPVAALSNSQIGVFGMSTPDHRVKISKYTNNRRIAPGDPSKWRDMQTNGRSHDILVERDKQYLNRSLVHLIRNLENHRHVALGSTSGAFREGLTNGQRRAQRITDNAGITSLLNVALSSGSAPLSANAKLSDGTINRRVVWKNNVRVTAAAADSTQVLADSMTTAIRAMKSHKTNKTRDLRDEVEAAAEQFSTSHKTMVRAGPGKPTVELLQRQSEDLREKKESLTVSNYSGVTPVIIDRHNADIDVDWSESRNSRNRGAVIKKEHAALVSTDAQFNPREFDLPPRREITHPSEASYVQLRAESSGGLSNDGMMPLLNVMIGED